MEKAAHVSLDQLSEEEQLALVALLKLIVRADKELSSPEVQQLQDVARQIGTERWRQLVATARERFRTQRDAKQQAQSISRREAQRAIYKTLVKAAKADELVPAEVAELLWLAKIWQIG
jgi:uncharacterized tellurite resistance protein B-like protein